MPQSLEQKRATYAWSCKGNFTTDYTNLAKAAPSLIMTNGLMQTLAFFASKRKDHHEKLRERKDHHEKLLKDVLGWLKKPEAACPFITSEQFSSAMDQLADPQRSSEQYLHATQEALAILKWIRHFAAAHGR